MADKGKEIISGNDGNVWVNTELWANLTNIEAKATAEYEDVVFVGDNKKYKRYTGTNIEGIITLKKTDSKAQKLLANGFRTGNMPEIKIVTTTAKVNGEAVERLVLYNVTFTELQLVKLEAGSMVEEELPLSASDFEYLDLI